MSKNLLNSHLLICLLSTALAVITFQGCQEIASVEQNSNPQKSEPLFALLPPEKTGITFSNTLTEGLNTNVMMYEYFYNGGGVAVGDINGDGLEDIYFTANMTSNKMYLNKGNMEFEDITIEAGVAGRNGPWKTGVTMVDINGDRLLDIYVCYSGKVKEESRRNQLFVNQGLNANGIPHFKEEAEKYGLASTATSTQATFFDYDNDGDLDMFLLNHNPNSIKKYNEAITARLLKEEDTNVGVRLFQNQDGYFEDVTTNAGFSSSALTYGLGAGVADINGDGWTDIYICNDYEVPDYLYLNNGDGTFTDALKTSFGHISHFSMGNDVADINNDGYPDIYTLDMLPEDNRRQKLLLAPDNYAKFELTVNKGFHYQYMRNMLQINNGNGTFSEVGQLAGISNTDWSWAALLADFDNDGLKDLFVTNGYLRDYTNMDFIKYMDSFVKQKEGNIKRQDVLELVNQMPASNVSNYIYKNNGNLTFEDKSAAWGIKFPTNSNGAAYADLDNDGDLDLIVNNINQPASIFQNQSARASGQNFLKIKLEGDAPNTLGIGAKVRIQINGQRQFLEQMPTRGYQSSVSPVLHFGTGEADVIDSVQVTWKTGRQQILTNVQANQALILRENDAAVIEGTPNKANGPLVFTEVDSPIPFQHKDLRINDFKRQPLMPSPMSNFGPCMAKGDVNGDGLEDVFIGGGNGQAGALYYQQPNGRFVFANVTAFEADKDSDDVDAVFFDANGDGALDLYVCSGGYDRYAEKDPALQDRIYFNDGKGNLVKSGNSLPEMLSSSGCVRVNDINGDGHPDLFVGSRVVPGRYPEAPESYLLLNDGKGTFHDETAALAPELKNAGMITDAAWVDLNGDNSNELVVVGEWMPIMVFEKQKGKLIENSQTYFSKRYTGLWNKILVDDFNNDGKPDLVIGNLGLNTQFKASENEPAEMIYKDFDNNGSVDPILCFYIQGQSYPYVTRDELQFQLSMMRSRFTTYQSYADATLTDIFTEEELRDVSRLNANYLHTAFFMSTPTGGFELKELPVEVQFSPVFSLQTLDFDKDGQKDIFVGGNIMHARLKFGQSDANQGLILKGDGNGNFTTVPQYQSNMKLSGDVRSSIQINDILFIGTNQKGLKAFQLNKQPDIRLVQND